MKKRSLFILSAAALLVLSACGGGGKGSSKRSSRTSAGGQSSSQPASSSQAQGNPAPAANLPIAQEEAYYSVPIGNSLDESGTKWEKGHTYTWTFTGCAAQQNVSFAIGAKMSNSSHGDRSLYTNAVGASDTDPFESNSANDYTPRFVVKVNNVEQKLFTHTYGDAGLDANSIKPFKVAGMFSIPAGNVTVELTTHATAGYRLFLGGEARLYYPKPAAPTLSNISLNTDAVKKVYTVGENLDLTGLVVTANYSDNTSEAVTNYTTDPANGAALNTLGGQTITVTYEGKTETFSVNVEPESWAITFVPAHCKVFVYEGTMVETNLKETNIAKSRDEEGVPSKYAEADGENEEVKAEVVFKLVADEGYYVDGNAISISGTMGTEWNKLSSEGDNEFQITKIRADLTVTVTAVAETGQEPEGYLATFNLEHCTVKVYAGKRNKDKNNFDTEPVDGKYLSRNKDSGAATKNKGQFNFEVVPDDGYGFDSGFALGTEVSPIGVSYVTGSYGNFKVDTKDRYLFNITKVATDLTINIKATELIAQPTGTFFASPELTEGGQLPILVQLGAGTVALRVNGNDIPNCVIKSFDDVTGKMVITMPLDAENTGDISARYNPENGQFEKLSLLWDKTMLKWDGYVNMRGNNDLKYWNCDGTTEELQAQFNRRSGNSSWSLDSESDRIVKNTVHAISGSAMQVNKKSDSKERIALSLVDFAQPFNARNISFWVYNDGESSVNLQAFYYKQVNYGGYQQIFSGKAVAAGQWTYVSVGFTAADVYAFQIVIPQGTASTLIFDEICLF